MKLKITIAGILFFGMAYAQHGANQVYTNQNPYNYKNTNGFQNAEKVSYNDDGITYRIAILNNVKPDSYMVTLGLNDEALSVKDCNAKINKRLDGFKSALKKMGIKEEEMFVDFISQTKIYDYKSSTASSQINITQVEKGFEIKKNIIIKLKDASLFDRLIDMASEHEIYNIIKVDYKKTDTEKIYDEMLSEANEVLKSRSKVYDKFGKRDFEEMPQLSVNFYSIQPGKQYKNYTASESSDISYYNEYYNSNKVMIRKEQRKDKTFYYDGIDIDSFDKIMNPDSPIVGIQYVMEFTITYKTKKKPKEETKKLYHIITPNGDVRTLDLKN
ncbi:SIMPL domain-containing protein [Flavobacterium microcysteis]